MIDEWFPGYNFNVIDGVTDEIDATQPAKYRPKGEVVNATAERIRNLRHRGEPVDSAQKFVATNNYCAADGNWRLASTVGSVVLQFDTGPATAAAERARGDVENVGPTATGFARYRQKVPV